MADIRKALLIRLIASMEAEVTLGLVSCLTLLGPGQVYLILCLSSLPSRPLINKTSSKGLQNTDV